MDKIIINDNHYEYLKVQKGEINHIEDRKDFEDAYNLGLSSLYESILPFVPVDLSSSLDVGSGLGGIDILLYKAFGQDVYLLDAIDSPPVCVKHDSPFGNYYVTADFFIKNRASLNHYFSPDDLTYRRKFDLILSIGSYCFHYSPLLYMDFIKTNSHAGTVLIFDVRNAHQDWLYILRENFEEVAVVTEDKKFTRRVFKCK